MMSWRTMFSLGILVFTLSTARARAQETPLLFFDVDAAESTLSLRLRTSERALAFTALFVLDPALYRVAGVSRGADLPPDGTIYSSLFPQGGVPYGEVGEVVSVTDPAAPLDGDGDPVEGGVVLAWLDSISDDFYVEPGESRELLVLHLEAVDGAAAGSVGELRFVDGLRTGEGSPELHDVMTDENGSTVACATEDRLLGIGVEIALPAVVLAPQPAEIFVEGGTKAVAWAATVALPYRDDGVDLGPVRFENLGLGDAADLVLDASLYRDADADGLYSAADALMAGPASFDAAAQSVVFADAGTVQPGGTFETWFLVLRLEKPVAEAAGLLPPVGTAAVLACLAALLLALAASRSLRRGVALLSLRRLAPAALCATLAISLAVAVGCSSGGGGGKDPRDLQIQLAELKITDAATAAELAVDGLPIVAWPFEV